MLKKFGYIILFLAVLGLSELIFIVHNHRQNIISAYAVWSAQKAVGAGNLQKGIDQLSWAAEINIKSLPERYSSFIPDDYQAKVDIAKSNPQFTKSIADYINSIDLSKIINSEEADLARVFYMFGLISYHNGVDRLTPRFFQTAVFLNPDLSFSQVEQANYYLLKGDRAKAQELIEYCQKFKDPYQHCQDYKSGILEKNAPEEPGFTEKDLEKYYESIRPSRFF